MYLGGNFYQGDTLLNSQFYLSPSIFDIVTAFTNAVLWSSESLISRSSSLALYFGNNATQNEEYLYIKKSDLVGLTPSINNTAESLLIALISRLIGINDEYTDVILISIFDTYINQNKITHTILIQLFYPATPAQIELDEPLVINPDNYGL
ncbi:hypothetical protein [Nostoc sp. FACHB-280]|uniref:hypothetical protein n=1 Tax=Nostoc sp. FACHB-280 TaxID=2692839 RepID=UPI00168A4507|nr:hypothetical protein [Nostoc sp. FACHB-280]MBD2495008.1 hypothetical protein [Nostoc sp. FACHB-280]